MQPHVLLDRLSLHLSTGISDFLNFVYIFGTSRSNTAGEAVFAAATSTGGARGG